MAKNGSPALAVIGIIALVVLIAIALLINDSIGNQITGAVYFSEPTYCSYDQKTDVTTLECACGRTRVRSGSISIRISYDEGRVIEAGGDYCLMKDQRDVCMELCKWSPLALLNMGQVRAPSGHIGTVELLSVEGRERPNYYPGHWQRARAGAYSYISGY